MQTKTLILQNNRNGTDSQLNYLDIKFDTVILVEERKAAGREAVSVLLNYSKSCYQFYQFCNLQPGTMIRLHLPDNFEVDNSIHSEHLLMNEYSKGARLNNLINEHKADDLTDNIFYYYTEEERKICDSFIRNLCFTAIEIK